MRQALKSRPVSSDETAVRAAAQHETEGWTKFDAAQIASCYTVDTTWQNPFGVRIHSRATLEKFLTNLFARPGYRSAKDTAPARITGHPSAFAHQRRCLDRGEE